jgi:hypothetical protein
LKNANDVIHGVMLFIEVQEGKDGMRGASLFDAVGAGGGCCLCLSMGAIGIKE